jgi:hypothetical protein
MCKPMRSTHMGEASLQHKVTPCSRRRRLIPHPPNTKLGDSGELPTLQAWCRLWLQHRTHVEDRALRQSKARQQPLRDLDLQQHGSDDNVLNTITAANDRPLPGASFPLERHGKQRQRDDDMR